MNHHCIDIDNSSHEELLKEHYICTGDLWSKYSCDCLGFYIKALHKRIVELGGWPVK